VAELLAHPFLWPSPTTGPYRVRLTFGRIDGRPVVVGVEMWGVQPPANPEAWHDFSIRAAASDGTDNPFRFAEVPPLPDVAVSAAAIRLPLGALLDGWVENNQAFGRALVASGADADAVGAVMEQYDGPKKKGAAPLPAALLENVARYYTEAVAAGDRAPSKAVVRRFKADEKRIVNAATARSWIAAARRRGFLTIPSQRRTK